MWGGAARAATSLCGAVGARAQSTASALPQWVGVRINGQKVRLLLEESYGDGQHARSALWSLASSGAGALLAAHRAG